MSCFSVVVWIIFFLRAEGLIQLQFEVFPLNESLLTIIPNYRALIPSIGTQGDEKSSAELLRDMYEMVQIACKNQKPWDSQQYLHDILGLQKKIPKKTIGL